MLVFQGTFHFKLLVTTWLKDYWGRVDLCSVSPAVIVALQERHMEYIIKLVLPS